MKAISSRTVHAAPGRAAASAVVVRLGAEPLRANDPSCSSTAAASAPPTGSTSARASRPVVSVPVLSVQTTSTLLTDSTALTRWTSAPRPAHFTAPTVYATAMSRNRP